MIILLSNVERMFYVSNTIHMLEVGVN